MHPNDEFEGTVVDEESAGCTGGALKERSPSHLVRSTKDSAANVFLPAGFNRPR